jgi:hypothetical protein
MTVLGDDAATGDPIPQDLLDGRRHGRRRLAATHNHDPANLGEIENLLTHAKRAPFPGQVAAHRLARVHGTHGGIEDLACCFSHPLKSHRTLGQTAKRS